MVCQCSGRNPLPIWFARNSVRILCIGRAGRCKRQATIVCGSSLCLDRQLWKIVLPQAGNLTNPLQSARRPAIEKRLVAYATLFTLGRIRVAPSDPTRAVRIAVENDVPRAHPQR